jgi:hypothetical protein
VSTAREYLIEVPHSPEECGSGVAFAAKDARRSLAAAYRGCGAGTHTTWMIVELETEDDAWLLVPRLLRDTARVVPVERMSPSSSCSEPVHLA